MLKSTSVFVQWTHIQAGECYNECIFYFDVCVYEKDKPDHVMVQSVDTQYVNWTKLSSNTSYHMDIRANCTEVEVCSEPLVVPFITEGIYRV